MSPPDRPTSTPRVMLANLAQHAVAQTPGLQLTPGEDGRWVTADRRQRISGVMAVAQGDGRVELDLHVIVGWPCEPLAQLADQLRERVRADARTAQLDDALGAVQITVESVRDPFAASTGEASA